MRRITQLGLDSSSCRLLAPGSLVLSMRGTIGNVIIAGVPLACNQSCEALIPRPGVNGEYLYYLLFYIRPLLERFGAGTTFQSITRHDIRDIRFALSPPEEQTRIAETLKAADDHIRALEEQIRKAERVKKALLEQATTLGLRNSPERRTIVRYRHPFTVNAKWSVVELRELKPQIEYGTNEPSNDHCAGVPIIAIPQVLSSRFSLSELPFAEVSEQERTALALKPHDVLLVRTNGNPSYIGRSTVIPEGVLSTLTVFASYLIRVRVDQQRLRGAFLNYVLRSETGRRQSNCLANTSAGNFNLGARSLSRFLIPIPSLSEQDEVVEAIDSADDLVLNLQQQLTAARRVKQSLLQNLLTGRIRLKP